MTALIRALWALHDAAGSAAVWLIDRREVIEEAFIAAAWVVMLVVYIVIF
jgi:hypothetical protein